MVPNELQIMLESARMIAPPQKWQDLWRAARTCSMAYQSGHTTSATSTTLTPTIVYRSTDPT